MEHVQSRPKLMTSQHNQSGSYYNYYDEENDDQEEMEGAVNVIVEGSQIYGTEGTNQESIGQEVPLESDERQMSTEME